VAQNATDRCGHFGRRDDCAVARNFLNRRSHVRFMPGAQGNQRGSLMWREFAMLVIYTTVLHCCWRFM
jgi:hypothetical protein